MKRTVHVLPLLSLLIVGSASGGDPISKRGTTAAPFLEFGVGPRAVGMGKAFTAIANDATAMYWNVAGLDLLTENEVSFSYMDWIADMDLMYAALVLKAGSAGTFGLSITSLSTPEMLVRTVEQPEGLGWRFDAADLAVGVSYAKTLIPDRSKLPARWRIRLLFGSPSATVTSPVSMPLKTNGETVMSAPRLSMEIP